MGAAHAAQRWVTVSLPLRGIPEPSPAPPLNAVLAGAISLRGSRDAYTLLCGFPSRAGIRRVKVNGTRKWVVVAYHTEHAAKIAYFILWDV